jgi:prefoldin subunit 5
MDERREHRRKALLADFYGAKGESGQSGDADADANNIDRPHFNVDQYCETLMQTESLAALQRRDGTLERQVVALDGEMKTLVYENYNKFISATDTIKQMKQNVEQLDDEMAALEASMSSLTQRTATIDAQLQPKRQHIQQLANVHALLEKVYLSTTISVVCLFVCLFVCAFIFENTQKIFYRRCVYVCVCRPKLTHISRSMYVYIVAISR